MTQSQTEVINKGTIFKKVKVIKLLEGCGCQRTKYLPISSAKIKIKENRIDNCEDLSWLHVLITPSGQKKT